MPHERLPITIDADRAAEREGALPAVRVRPAGGGGGVGGAVSLEGVCSECGYGLRWAEVLRPEKFAPRWCVEFERDPRA